MRISDWSSDVCSSDLAGGDMSEESEQRRRLPPFEGERLPEQFVDRIARLAPQSAIELAPPVERPRQQRVEEAKGRREIGHAEPSAQRRHRLGLRFAFARAQCFPPSAPLATLGKADQS